MGTKYCAGDYMTKSVGSLGAGDILNGFLGPVILSFAFSMYRQRKVGTWWKFYSMILRVFCTFMTDLCGRIASHMIEELM